MKKSILISILSDSRLYIFLLALLLVILSSSRLGTSKLENENHEIHTLQIENTLYQIPQDDVECNKVKYIKH